MVYLPILSKMIYPPRLRLFPLIRIKNSSQSFSDIKEVKDPLFFINVKQLSSKCIKLTPDSDKYLISEFIISDEHD